MNPYKTFCATETGISHSKHDKKCQDYSEHYDDETVAIAVLADGHGSEDCFRSARGAEFAVKSALLGIKGLIKYLNKKSFSVLPKEEIENILRERLIENGIIPAWFNEIAKDFTKLPVTATELQNVQQRYREKYEKGENLHHAYGATLIAAAITEDYWFGIHIGDGRFTALYKDGTFDQPVPWDKRCYLNVTTSICDDDAAKTARIYYCHKTEKDLPLAVFLCSDGIDDNYPVLANEKHLYKLYKTIALTFAEEGFDSTCTQIKDLVKSFATKGKGDDTSLALIIDMAAIKDKSWITLS
jgi:serine/threonine protein phosphatase PrpC